MIELDIWPVTENMRHFSFRGGFAVFLEYSGKKEVSKTLNVRLDIFRRVHCVLEAELAMTGRIDARFRGRSHGRMSGRKPGDRTESDEAGTGERQRHPHGIFNIWQAIHKGRKADCGS